MIPPLLELVLFLTVGVLAVVALVLTTLVWGAVDGQGGRLGQHSARLNALEAWRAEHLRLMATRTRPGAPPLYPGLEAHHAAIPPEELRSIDPDARRREDMTEVLERWAAEQEDRPV